MILCVLYLCCYWALLTIDLYVINIHEGCRLTKNAIYEITHHPDDGGSKLLWNIDPYLPDYTMQHPRRQPSSSDITHLLMAGVCCGSSGGMVSWLRSGRSGFPTGAEDFSSSPCFQTSSGAHPSSYPIIQWVPGVLSPGVKRSRGMTLTTHPHLVPRLSMIGAIPPLPPCASMACSRTALL
jgi:hypothetical protein